MNINELSRANRITVQAVVDGFVATFYRTHKELAKVSSADTSWEAKENSNKTAQREDFRQFVIDNADVFGILWNPQDMRSEDNKRIAKYTDEPTLIGDAIALIEDDICTLVEGCGLDITYGGVKIEECTAIPKTHTSKGTDLSTLGIEDGKYIKSGNWAWADVEMSFTFTKEDKEIYFLTNVELVSGQLKKPHLTKTAFAEEVKKSLEEVGFTFESKEAKAEESAEAEPQTLTKAELFAMLKDKEIDVNSKMKKSELEAIAKAQNLI